MTSTPATENTTSSPEAPTTYYVSITGLTLKSIWYLYKFQTYSVPSMRQATRAQGNISAQGNYRNGVLHTLSVWKDRKSMVRFMASGDHAKAMKIANEVSAPSGTKVYGYETQTIPTWDEAIQLWNTHGRVHGAKKNKNDETGPGAIEGQSSSSSSVLTPSVTKQTAPWCNSYIRKRVSLAVFLSIAFYVVYG